jgi:hypothetical protein
MCTLKKKRRSLNYFSIVFTYLLVFNQIVNYQILQNQNQQLIMSN